MNRIHKTIGILLIFIVFFVVLFLNQNQPEFEREYLEEYVETFVRDVENDYFLFPVEKTISFGVNKDFEKQVGKYEEVAKDKAAILIMEYKDTNGKVREVYAKVLDLNDENVSYILQHYTNYFDVFDLSQTAYRFKFVIDNTKEEEYKKDVNSGAILVSDDTIFVIMSNDESVVPFLEIFDERNETRGTFLQYLDKNPEILARIARKVESIKAQTRHSAQQDMPEDVKKFALNMWEVYIALDIEQLKQYYADNVWFYAGKEWFEEWGIPYEEEKIHKFVEVEKNNLFEAYQNLKAEDFQEDFAKMQEIVNGIDDIELYRANDLMNICHAEDKNAFFDFFRINQDDIVMIVRLDDANTCTIDGRFFGDEVRFWVIRNFSDTYKIVTDYTE